MNKKGISSAAWNLFNSMMNIIIQLKCAKCGGEQFVKEMDIFDVWFESGSSHHAVLRKRPELSHPTICTRCVAAL